MHTTKIIIIAAFGVFLGASLYDFPAVSAEGKGMSGPEFEKLMIGNTLERPSGLEKKNGKAEMRTYYFVDNKKLVYVSDRNNKDSQPLTTTWAVNKSGRFCWFSSIIYAEICYHSFRLEADKMIATSARSNTELTFTLVRGLQGFDRN